MAEEEKTPEKRPFIPFKGVESGVSFSAENQPSPAAKSNGWKERRAERLLTQAILSKMTEGSNLEEYIESLLKNARLGNAKAIETINAGIEDDIKKIEHSGNVSVTDIPISFK